ncbi:MAG: glycosyltransferase [Patescibacteria group bacterium]|nr:glycosyltransferase [Patescibacteria group bacterium]MBU1953018.1 glycosyltransferase [Patescibacteria group bacterium]
MAQEKDKYNVICLSNQLWDFPLWTNKRHVMGRLPKLGHNVLFVDPPINFGRIFLKYLFQGKWSISRFFTWRKKEAEFLEIFSPLNFHHFTKYLSVRHAKKIDTAAQQLFDSQRKTILWVYHVELEGLENYLKYIKHDFLVYDCVDNYEAFPKYDTLEKRKKISDQEKLLASRANIVFATTPGLVEKLRKYNPNCYFTPNVGDYDRFIKIKSRIKEVPENLINIPRPIIAFTGALDEYKFDKQLFKKVASDYPGYSFVVIGPVALKDKNISSKQLGFGDLKNVFFLGTKKYEDMPMYLANFDVMIIPYQLNDYTVGGCFPVKFLDYLAAGLPVVVTDLPSYTPFSSVCYIAKNPNEFSQNIRRALEENSQEKIKLREEQASKNTWEGKVYTMLSLISENMNKI